ncbi:hypothetical protein CPB84DRAFT_1853108 [Gymnopilus junonius]|uniref:HAUS augmin-like complex subunit 6 N-terminal domain-containing protein n=1 Tax=Gymnopilus junonius TaxID=109634 RepID=A0A9P5NAR3_GYMJU|nr:hypothetical protein CPB84DRAFT_1853108 [Gymnopilus junonius]
MTLLSLPLSLILLVHLHILEYPHANNSEYDHDVFNPRKRGLRERAQTMEDVAYFLVSKLEGKNVKTVLPTYPCGQPSESLAFRTSLSKYLENLRHQCVYTSSSHARTPAKSTSRLKSSDSNMAWWWKDVVVRKSLLEECSGDKFERLILSLSTHALMKVSGPLSPDTMSILLRDQPAVYAASLARYQTTRHVWTKAASSLLRSEHDLQLVRESLSVVSSTKYASLSTERLQALVESKLQSLLQFRWTGEGGKKALFYFIELASLRRLSANLKDQAPLLQIDPAEAASIAPIVPSPLPIAAAHHPAQLKKFRRPVFQQPKGKLAASDRQPSSATPPVPTRSHAEIMLAPQLDSEKRVHQALVDALARTKRMGEELKMKVDELSRHASLSSPVHLATVAASSLNLFWTPTLASRASVTSADVSHHIDFNPKPTRELMLSLSLESEFDSLNVDSDDATAQDGHGDDELERKIRDIRVDVLPPYPTLPDPTVRMRHPSAPISKDAGGSKSKLPNKGQFLKSGIPSKVTNTSTAGQSLVNLPTHRELSSKPAFAAPIPPPPTSPLISPSKSSEMRSIRRKSVRFSMAKRRSGRPSMFRTFGNGLEDDVDKLIDETHDFPTDDEDSDSEFDHNVNVAGDGGITAFPRSPFKTPKKFLKSRTPINRIWTAGTPKADLKFQQKMRQSSLPWEVGGFGAGGGVAQFRVGRGDVDATPRPARTRLPASPSKEEEEDVFDDPPSMTLKDILLSADTSHFDLLELSSEDVGLGDGMLVDDASFIWE